MGPAPVPRPPAPRPPKNTEKLDAASKLETLLMDADDLAASGKFTEAIEKLESFPQELRKYDVWSELGERDLKKYRALLPLQEEFESAVEEAKAGSTDALKALFRKVRGEDFEYPGEPFVAAFERRAREAVGEDAFDALLTELDDEAALASADEVDAFEEDADQNVKIEAPKAIEITTKGSPERRERFREAAQVALQNLEQAKKTLAERVAARRKRIKDEARRVLKAARKMKLSVDGWGTVRVTAYDESGFTIKGKKGTKTFGWGNCPPKLGHTLKKLAVDTKDAQAVYELGIYALKRGEFDLAQRDFEQALRLDASLKDRIPNVDGFRHLTKLFRGKTAKDDDFQVRWEFNSDRPQERLDFEPLAQQMKVEVVGGQLQISSPMGFFAVGAKVRGGWDGRVSIEAVLGTTSPAPAVVVQSRAGMFLVQFGQKTEVLDGFGPMAKSLASSEVRAAQGNAVKVWVERKGGDKGTVKVTVQGREALEHEIDLEGDIELMLGARGNGSVRFDNIHVVGRLSPKWERKAKAEGPNEISRQLAEMERQRQAAAGGVKVPIAYLKTSAEDEVGLRDATEEQKKLVEEGRAALAAGNMWAAFQKFEQAARDYRFEVGNYLYSLGLMRSDPQGAVIRLKRCVKGVEDFYEAQVALAQAQFQIGRIEEAEALLRKALELRADYAPAYQALSQIHTIRGEYQEAKKTLELAEVLGPGDPMTTALMDRVVALAEGPAWADRKRATTTHYVLDTDMVDYADRFVTQLESIRKAYERAYPALIDPDAPERKASVLIFGAAEGYYQYSERTSGDRAENTLGHFSPMTGQLLLFLEEDPDDWNSYHVIFHEGMHQWVHSNGLALPFWANEGMAEYVGGTRLSEDGSEIVQMGAIDSFLKQRLRSLTSGWSQRLTWRKIMSQSPQEFYAGNAPLKYAQAWTMIHFIMESGDEELKKTFDSYLRHFKEVDRDDKDAARGGAMLEYIYVDTFHQLDMADVTKRWERWVEKLCADAGLDWKLPAEEGGK
ncbi:MAG: DUF1570 domain-containing protein [Planctomycetota bacterium]|nr:MAG: DUF1570 domain-containing protein [Planctomycetota bacterium]